MADRPTARLSWRALDSVDHLVTLARLRILDVLAGPSRRRRPISGAGTIENI
jgi:hypothetical protein